MTPAARNLAAGGVLVAVVAGALVGVVFATRGDESVAATMRGAGCTYRDVRPFPPRDAATANNYHLDFPTLATKPHWSTFPPSAGGHYRLWAIWGFYRHPANPRMVVHNEEHGGVVLWWDPSATKAMVDRLKAFYDEQPHGVFGTPIAGLGPKLALTAWTVDPAWKGNVELAYSKHDYGIGRIAICPRFDQKAFAAFRDAFRGKSPQGFPLALDAPGCGPETTCPPKR